MPTLHDLMDIGAQLLTSTAFNATVSGEGQERFAGYAFRIVTPEAFQRATFEKNSCADARSVMHGERLKSENAAPYR